MADRKRICWTTAAYDTATALEAIILSKSLARVITTADIIVFTPLDISNDIEKALSPFFDAVISINVEREHLMGFSLKDYLLLSSWNLGMYDKCIIINSRAMVIRNCDEFFKLEGETTFVTGDGKKMDSGLALITPNTQTYKQLLKSAVSKEFSCLSNLLNEHRISREIKPSQIYYYSTMNASLNVSLSKAKIVVYDNTGSDGVNGVHKDVNRMWMSFLEEIKVYLGSIQFPKLPSMIQSPKTPRSKKYYKDAIAIVGHSCRFPASNNIEEFWTLLKTAGDGIIPFPLERLTDAQRTDPKYTESRAGFLKCPIDEFDAKFFGISPREAAFMDPQQRLLVEVAWEALENAAINPQSLKASDTGVFSGVWTHDYEHLINENTTAQDFHHVILGNSFSATSARVSYFLGLNGPNIAIESGCSSSMVALHLACESLRQGETKLGLIMGANIMVNQFPLTEVPILAPDGHCKTFDQNADGFGRAEGVAVVIVKRLADAVANGDRIMGIIRSSAISNEGTSSNFGTPSKLCQEIAVKEAIRKAGIEPGDVDYVEAHGTGTPVGDPIEFAALSSGYYGKRDKPLLIGSVKTNTGHTESASGLAGVIKILLAMKHETIPAHRNFTTLNSSIDLDLIPAVIPLENQQWCRNSDRVRIAGVSSFGISGTNVHAILEEPPDESYYQECGNIQLVKLERTHQILTLSAKSKNALSDLSNKYIQYFQDNSNSDIANATYTANCGRAHLKCRNSVVFNTTENAITNLLNLRQNSSTLQGPLKIALLFTGQGSQYSGMAKALYDSNMYFRNAFDECDKIVYNNLNIWLIDALWKDSSSETLQQTAYSQLSIFAVEYSLMKLWESLGVQAEFVLGHSVGEFAAAVCAKILSLKDAINLLCTRSRLIQTLPSGGMIAVHCSKKKLSELAIEFLGSDSMGWLDVAVINSPDEIVVAGNNETISLFNEFCTQKGIKSKMLDVSHAFHSRVIDGVLQEFGEFANGISYDSPSCGYISCCTGSILQTGEMNGEYWQKHARETVNFVDGMKTLSETDCNVFIEIGAHPILLALGMVNISDTENKLWLPSIRRTEYNWKTFLESLGSLYCNGFDVKWEALDNGFCRKKMELPTYPFQRQKYWMEITKEGVGKPLHPLLGRKVTLADVKDIVYEHTWSLKELQYFEDHQVANTIVLPGAGFLELILAAGKDVLISGKLFGQNVVNVKDFVIESPLELDLQKKSKIQVIVTPIDVEDESQSVENKHLVKVYVYKNLNGYNDERGWKQYASAHVSLCRVSNLENNDNLENPENIKTRCPFIIGSEEFYKLAPEIGINFGEMFQSIETVWQGENEVIAKIPLPSSKGGNLADYVYHPIVLDAMIQSFGFSIGKQNKYLYLPVGVDTFSMFVENCKVKPNEYFYAHAQWENTKTNGTVLLYNDTNTLLAKMEGVRLLQTSTNSFLNVVNAQKNMLPGMYQEVWRMRDGSYQSRVNLKSIPNSQLIKQELCNSMEKYMIFPNEEVEILSNELYCLTLISNFIKNGWNPQLGEIFSTASVVENLLFFNCYSSFIHRILEILCEDGYSVEIPSEDSEDLELRRWKIIKVFPDIAKISEKQILLINSINAKSPNGEHVISKIAYCCTNKLMTALQEKGTAVSVLFDGDEIDPLDVYTKGIEVILSNIRMAKYLELAFKELKPSGQHDSSIVRILEIGAGSGSTSKEIIKHLQNSEIQFRYTFTDISQHFFENAKQQLASFSGVDFKTLDIEKNPFEQGFCPHYFDIVIAANVIHATKCLKNSVSNIYKLIAPDGYLMLQEMLYPSRHIDMIFGLLEGYWKFTDLDLRKSHPMASKNVWDQVFAETGFSESTFVSRDDEHNSVLVTRSISQCCNNLTLSESSIGSAKQSAWIIYCDNGKIHENLQKMLSQCTEKIIKIKNSEPNGENSDISPDDIYLQLRLNEKEVYNILDKLHRMYNVVGFLYLTPLNENSIKADDIYYQTLHVCKYLAVNTKSPIQICTVSRGAQFTSNQEKMNPPMAPVLGMMKALGNETPLIDIKLVDLDPDNIDEWVESQEILFQLFAKNESCISIRNRKKMLNRMVTLEKPMAPLPLPKGRYKIEIPSSKKINDVTFRNYRDVTLNEGELEILVKATALNFRDIFVIMKPKEYSTHFNAVGTDFAGIISKIGPQVTKYKVGDSVFGISNESSAASHVKVHYRMVLRKPMNFTFAEASTLPSVFFTAWHCLVDVANLKKGESILIHVASGGVGLIAIQIAKHLGAKIIATAGSYRKRSYLKSIGVKHVFHSRDLSFADEIQKVTNGRGVDMVLNSLTGKGFVKTSLSICAQDARFVEMGKVNIWTNDEVQELRPDVHYTIVDVETLDLPVLEQLMNTMEMCVHKEIVVPLPYSRFEVSHLRDALNYFLKSQHIGKIVVGMPEVRGIGAVEYHSDCIFNENATYLITGGLGGIGLEVAKWMADCGAQNIVLVGRSLPTEKVVGVINKLKSRGCKIVTMQVDVGQMWQCQKLFDTIADVKSELPPLKGVIHSAGALSDAVYGNQTWEKYQTVFNAKVNGGWNLHELTKNMYLEHFVLFSSVASMCNPPGQSNHGGANMFLDALMHYRYSVGLPAQSVNWGAWSEIGAATNTVYGNEGAFGIKPFTPLQGIAALRFQMIRPNIIQLGIVQLDMKTFIKVYCQMYPTILELFAEHVIDSPTHETNETENFTAAICKMTLEERFVYIKSKLEKIVRNTLKLPESEPIDEHQKFSELGLDSLMAIEMKNKLQNIIGKSITLSATSLLDYPNIHGLSKFLAEETMSIIDTSIQDEAYDSKENLEAMHELAKTDSILPEEIINCGNCVEKDKIQNVLLTGCTGQMGPYILKELLENESLNVYCLIRSKNEAHARKKLNAAFKKVQIELPKITNYNHISIVVGNFSDEGFGLPVEEYVNLCHSIDCILHFGAKVNHVEKYQATKSNVDIRSVNVKGTTNILRFASQIKTKYVVYASTYTAINRLTSEGFHSEEFPDPENCGDGINNGYVLSKFVGEKLLSEAVNRGIPCSVIRYPTITGDSKSGHFAIDKNLMMNFILMSGRLGIFPDTKHGWNTLPINIASKLTMQLAFNRNAEMGVYNLFHPYSLTATDIVNGATECGIDICVVSLDEYFSKFEQASKEDDVLTVYLDAFVDLKKGIFRSGLLNSSETNDKGTFRFSEKFLTAIPNVKEHMPDMKTVFKSHIEFSKMSGLLEKIGVKLISAV